ncbi:hypothetical protein NBM05_07055 [Rothia sp. AR01]|uniref:Uncharacterized protein n=1 Tax=Rothia santali TaxID=2949643 RepID=A0A9X2KL60_9MICC|nr:hypothetical protein [Rothia santali]MCP3425771.1 hypothetical protein [Rothia santali]
MSDPSIMLADPAQSKDLATLLSRVRSIDDAAAVRLQARGSVLAAWVPVMSGETLLEQVPTVLGMRALHLAAPADLDLTVQASAILDRLARQEKAGGVLTLPPVEVRAAWAGVVPPAAGWERAGTVSAEEIDTASREGMRAVEAALPANPGAAVLSTVRSRIWGTQDERGIVTGAAFGATVLGFNDAAEAFELFTNGPWSRLSNRAGHILARRPAAL